MNFVRFVLDNKYGDYSSQEASNAAMCVLGMFLSDIGCSTNGRSIFLDWALADKNDPHCGFTHTCGTNAILLEEDDDGYIHLIDDTGGDPDDVDYVPARIKMTREQFVQLLGDWLEKVCQFKPKEVIITYENNQFSVETKN